MTNEDVELLRDEILASQIAKHNRKFFSLLGEGDGNGHLHGWPGTVWAWWDDLKKSNDKGEYVSLARIELGIYQKEITVLIWAPSVRIPLSRRYDTRDISVAIEALCEELKGSAVMEKETVICEWYYRDAYCSDWSGYNHPWIYRITEMNHVRNFFIPDDIARKSG